MNSHSLYVLLKQSSLRPNQWKGALAAVWLQQRRGKSVQKNLSKFPWLPADSQAELLPSEIVNWPAVLEGEEGFFSPEVIALAEEWANTAKRTHGIFYTPYPLAKQLAQEVLQAWLQNELGNTSLPPIGSSKALALEHRLAEITICDPAAGAGGLLIPFWLELAKLRLKLNPKQAQGPLLLSIFQHNLYAGDIRSDALASLRLRAALTLLAHDVILPDDFGPRCLTGDALAGAPKSVWKTAFPKVTAREGFDIFLTNPPYIGQKNHRGIFSSLRKNPRWQDKITPKGDLLYLFFYLGLELTRLDGILGFITTSYFAQAASGTSLRRRLKQETTCTRLIDFENRQLFKQAPGQNTLLSVFRHIPPGEGSCRCGPEKQSIEVSQQQLYHGPECFLQTRPVPLFIQTALQKMSDAPHRLQEVAAVSNGLMTGCDKISAAHVRKFSLKNIRPGTGVFVLSSDDKSQLTLTPKEEKKLKPFFKNSSIDAYRADNKPTRFLIDFFYPRDRELNFDEYPNLMAHLKRFKPVLLARKQNNNGIDKQLAQGNYWFGSVRRKMDFETEKIVVPHRCRQNVFAYTSGPWYASSDVYFISAPHTPFSLWYLLALFNSTPYYAWLFYNGKRKGNLLELYSAPLNALPVPLTNKKTRTQLENLARDQYAHSSVERQEKIDQMVAQIFNFSNEEQSAINALHACVN